MILTDKKGYEYMKWEEGSSFPFGVATGDITKFSNNSFECHWHDGVELLYVIEGEIDHIVNGKHFLMKKGDFMFVNSGSMHEGRATPLACGKFRHISFLISFLCPEQKSKIAERYFSETMNGKNFPTLYLPAGNEACNRLIELGNEVTMLFEKQPICYEMLIKSAVFKMWSVLYEEAVKKEEKYKIKVPLDRIKKAIEYIEENYKNKISLDEIAAKCNVSKSELCRSFKRVTRRTVFDYIMTLRVKNSIELLESGKSVTEAATTSGFFDSSYYAKVFKRYIGYTPKEYLEKIR